MSAALKKDEPKLTVLDRVDPDIETREHGVKSEIVLTASDLKVMWDLGAIDNTSYIALAFKFDDEGKLFDVDIENFIFRWRGELPNDKGNFKELKPDQVEAAIAKLKKKGAATVRQSAIQMSLNF